MGCFTACFGSSKRSKTKNPSKISLVKDQNLCHGKEINEDLKCIEISAEAQYGDPVNVTAEIKNKDLEQINCSSGKKVTFDLNVKCHEEAQSPEEANLSVGGQEDTEGGKREKSKNEFRHFLCEEKKKEEKTEIEKGKDEADAISDSSASSLFSYPPNNRYQNCTTSEDESEIMASSGDNLTDDQFDSKSDDIDKDHKNKDGCEGRASVQEESSESLFSLSIDSRKQFSEAEMGEKEVCSPLKPCQGETKIQNARVGSQFADSVLNPIENLSQWKAVRGKTTSPLKHQEKENIIHSKQEFTNSLSGKENVDLEQEFAVPFSSEEPTFKKSQRCSRQISKCPEDDDIAIETSLSSWLIESDQKTLTTENSPSSVGNSTSKRTMSPRSFEDRPILGALTVDELKQMSMLSSPIGSPSFSPDEKPIIGTVGSYWRHTGEAMDVDSASSCGGTSSMSRQCRKGKPNSQFDTPFQRSLENALNRGTAEVQ